MNVSKDPSHKTPTITRVYKPSILYKDKLVQSLVIEVASADKNYYIMKRTNIDYGIDLGTTNSAIARMDAGNSKIIKSDGSQKDTTPSCVAVNRSGAVIVGDDAYKELERARNKKKQNPNATVSDAFSEFKRLMGTDQVQQSSHLGHDLTPEDLSAEVLKKLKSYVKDEDVIPAVVITVPAKSSQTHKMKLLEMPPKKQGLTRCELLQGANSCFRGIWFKWKRY